MIYFAQIASDGPVKVGFTDDLPTRRKALENLYGCRLTILATMQGGRDEERAIHNRFAHLRLGRTEQFRPAAELMAFIGRPLLVGVNSDTVEVMPAIGERITIINLKGSEEFRDWLAAMVEKTHIPASTITRLAYQEWAKRNGHPEPPKM